jgi:tripartite-type tricarboxylate transporter receptor subunit TctC
MLSRRLLLGAALAVAFPACAETWPARPIRVILPGPAGGLIDIAGRAIGDAMQKELGQTWLIDPRPGANGIVAGQMFLASPADGYTLYLTVSGHVALPFLMKAPFDVMADFKPIAMVGVSTALLCVPPASPANTIAEFVAYAKANPGKLNYLNSGNGTGAHLLPELLKIKYDIDVTSIS